MNQFDHRKSPRRDKSISPIRRYHHRDRSPVYAPNNSKRTPSLSPVPKHVDLRSKISKRQPPVSPPSSSSKSKKVKGRSRSRSIVITVKRSKSRSPIQSKREKTKKKKSVKRKSRSSR